MVTLLLSWLNTVLAVRRIDYSAIAAARILSKRGVVLQDIAVLVSNISTASDAPKVRTARCDSWHWGSARWPSRGPGCKFDLGAGWVMIWPSPRPRAVLLRAGDVGRVFLGLTGGEPRKAQPRCQHAGERTQMVDPRLFRAYFEAYFEMLFGTYTVLHFGFLYRATGSAVRHRVKGHWGRGIRAAIVIGNRCGLVTGV